MKSVVALTVVLTVSALSQSVQRLTLDDAIAIGQKKSKTLIISAAKVEGASAKADEARAVMLPSLKFAGGYARLSDVPPFEIGPPVFPKEVVIAPSPMDSYNARVTLQQPLFTGFRLKSNARAAEYLARASESDRENDKNDLTLNITAAYWMLYQAHETKKFVDENVNRLLAYRKDTENLMKAGLATRNDLLKIEVQLSSAKLSQIDAANDVEVAMMNLNNVMGQAIETQIELASSPRDSASESAVQTPGSLTEKAFALRPDLQSMQSRIEASKASLYASRGNYYPQIFLAGNYYYNRPNSRYQPTIDAFKSSWDLGVQVQFDIWNWGATSSEVEQAKSLVTQNENIYGQMKDNVVLEVKQYYLAVARARDKINLARVGVDQSEENARTTRDKYTSGLATSSELLDADVALLQAHTNYTGALVEQEIAVARLRKSVGGE